VTITKHDVPSDPSQTVYPIFWGLVQDKGYEPVADLDPRDQFWKTNDSIPSTNLSVAQAMRRNNVKDKKGGGGS
jgi:hypothetical protein